MASVRTTEPPGSPAILTAARNAWVPLAIASSRVSASTSSCAPYLVVPMPVAMPLSAATASASSTISSRVKTRSPSASTPTLHFTGVSPVRGSATASVKGRQHLRELLQASQIVAGQQQVDMRLCHHHAKRARAEVSIAALMRVQPDDAVAKPREALHGTSEQFRVSAV